MAAPKQNKYWQFRDKHGRDYKYKPEELWTELIAYAEWVEDNPLLEQLTFHAQGTITKTDSPKMRAMTLKGFQLFADISHTTWDNYEKNEDFIAITTRIRDVIYTQKFEGAASNLLQPNIIARELGLREHSEQEIKLVDEFDSKSDDELKKYIEDGNTNVS